MVISFEIYWLPSFSSWFKALDWFIEISRIKKSVFISHNEWWPIFFILLTRLEDQQWRREIDFSRVQRWSFYIIKCKQQNLLYRRKYMPVLYFQYLFPFTFHTSVDKMKEIHLSLSVSRGAGTKLEFFFFQFRLKLMWKLRFYNKSCIITWKQEMGRKKGVISGKNKIIINNSIVRVFKKYN